MSRPNLKIIESPERLETPAPAPAPKPKEGRFMFHKRVIRDHKNLPHVAVLIAGYIMHLRRTKQGGVAVAAAPEPRATPKGRKKRAPKTKGRTARKKSVAKSKTKRLVKTKRTGK
jgi:hypothetical protein